MQTNNPVRKCFLVFFLMLLQVTVVLAGNDPIITIKTNRYATYGMENNFQFCLMASPEAQTTQVEVDFGYGKRRITVDYQGVVYEDDSLEVLVGGTLISGSVSREGIVRVYGTAKDIDYLDVHGSEVYDIDFSALDNLTILSLAHNEIAHLDVSGFEKLSYLDLKDNPFNEGVVIGDNHPDLYYINLNQMGENALADGTVDLSQFSSLRVFTAWDSKCLRTVDFTNNTLLHQVSIDNSGVSDIDVSMLPYLMILNVSDCGIGTLDVTHNPYLVELYATNDSQTAAEHRLQQLDVTQNIHLQRLFVSGNDLTDIDISNCYNLITFEGARNKFTHFSVEGVDSLASLDLSMNYFDFATLPYLDPMTYFYYDVQNDMQVAHEYKVGTKLDLSHRVLRPGTNTGMVMFLRTEDEISDPVVLIEGIDYKYVDGVITFLKTYDSPVYCTFYNDFFPALHLSTTRFYVRSESDYGKPVEMISLTPKQTHAEVTFDVRAFESDETLYVDFGDGKRKEYTIGNDAATTISATAMGKVVVYGRIGLDLSAVEVKNVPLDEISVSRQKNIEKLTVTGCQLEDIDLSWNNRLVKLDLSNNALSRLDLKPVNDAFHKNVLSMLNASNNHIEQIDLDVAQPLHIVNLSNNKLTEIDMRNMYSLENINLSDNQLAEISFTDCESLSTLNLSHNNLKEIDITPLVKLESLDLTDNNLRISTLPLDVDVTYNYVYAPQKNVVIAQQANSVDLSSEAEVNDIATVYTWRNAETNVALEQNVDYTASNGKFVFGETVQGQKLYCEMTNTQLPQFADQNVLRTTEIEVAGVPQYVVASFTTPVGEESAMLSLAAADPDTYIYIDWGDGDMQEFALQTTYQLFEAKTIEGATVKVYSGTQSDGGVTVFSISNISMGQVDVSKMARLSTLTISGAGLTTIDLSHNPELRELNLGNNNLSSIDLSNNTKLGLVYLAGNHFDKLDMRGCNSLYWLQAPNNGMTEINVEGLTSLDVLDLTHNNLSEIDLSTCTSLSQLVLAENNFKNIDLSANQSLVVVNINNNLFDFTTLPETGKWNVYYYANQADLHAECVDGIVDLSAQAMVGDTPSEYYFFEGPIEYVYEEGYLDIFNYEYVEGVDYFVNEGRITFAEDHPEVTGLILNEAFPDILLFTETISVTADPSAITEVKAETRNDKAYNIIGQRVAKDKRGIVISNGKKIYIK